SGRGDRGVVLSIVQRLVPGRRPIVTRRMEPPMIEPADVLQGGQFQLVEAAPRPVPLHQFGLVQAVHRLGERVAVGISFTTNRNRRTSLGKPLRVTHREILPCSGSTGGRNIGTWK